jgi:hypothetical protein
MNIIDQKVVKRRVNMYGGFQTEVAPVVVKSVREPSRLNVVLLWDKFSSEPIVLDNLKSTRF